MIKNNRIYGMVWYCVVICIDLSSYMVMLSQDIEGMLKTMKNHRKVALRKAMKAMKDLMEEEEEKAAKGEGGGGNSSSSGGGSDEEGESSSLPPKKKRGRPFKAQDDDGV